jgi:hypothetical protein
MPRARLNGGRFHFPHSAKPLNDFVRLKINPQYDFRRMTTNYQNGYDEPRN